MPPLPSPLCGEDRGVILPDARKGTREHLFRALVSCVVRGEGQQPAGVPLVPVSKQNTHARDETSPTLVGTLL